MTPTAALSPFKDQVLKNEPLSQYTYMRVGGPADYLAVARTKSDLIHLIAAAKDGGIRYLVLGGGSNAIFSDTGYRGLAIVNRANRCVVDGPNRTVTVESGASTNMLVNQAIQAGLAGLETFLGVPGSVGGALYNNSHYLKELIGDYVDTVELLGTDGNIRSEKQPYFNFAYDYSILQQTHEIVLQAIFSLDPGDPRELREKADAALQRRRLTQPLEMASSGCIFKNFGNQTVRYPLIPDGVSSAGALIDKAGLKGLTVGGAKVSEVHANFIVNTGNATCRDIIDLMNLIKSRIHDTYGLMLKPEVFFLNEVGERIPE